MRALIALCGVTLLTAASAGGAAEEAAGAIDPEVYAALEARFIGPPGNRVSAVTGVAGDPAVYYAGAASGGIFKTTDGGAHWRPVFDDQPVASIGALAVAPSDPNVVWAGTGESFIRSNVSLGNGVYRSTDGGESWRHTGLAASGRIARIALHPTDPEIAWAAALGHAYGPQPERGVYRTTDGGESWQQVLFVDPDTGAVDVVVAPHNPRLLYAATWQLVIRPWGRESGGPGSGLWFSRDGGTSWRRLTGAGLPEPPWGKIGLALSAADPERVYALIETSSNRDFAPVGEHQGVLWRSDDDGESWERVNSDHTLVQRPLYYTRAVASPVDADEVHFLAVSHSRSLDGGRTYEEVDDLGGDHHDMWIDPKDPRRMIVGHDQGVSLSIDRGKSWRRPLLPNAQMYHVAVDDQVPYFVYGNRQDGPSFRGPSNTLTGGPIPIGAWQTVGGCESGFAVPEPGNPNIVWSGCYDGILERYDDASGQVRNVMVWPEAIESRAAAELRYRFQWTFPIVVSPHDPQRVYVGSQHVHSTTDGGQSWREISPDLTGADPELMRRSGGLTPDDASPTLAPVVFALAESPLEPGVIWAGTNDGRVQVTRDGGGTWADVTAAIPGLPPLGTVSNVEPSRHRPGTGYLTVDRHQLGDTRPYVYKTADYGATWRAITVGVPPSTHSYAHCVREDPERPGMLYLGTENALYVSFDDGARWQPLQNNLPPAPVHWIEVQERFGDLVVATYGRGLWILDDLSPLRQLTPELLAPRVHLFAPRPTYRFRTRERSMVQPDDPAAGENPAYGAILHIHLAAEPEADEKLWIAILDDAGTVVRELEEIAAKPGIQRLVWDLRFTRSAEAKLRTPPVEHAHEKLPEKGWRPLAEGERLAPLAPPGRYVVRLRLGETELTQPLEVLADPRSAGSLEGIRAQTEAVLAVRAALDSVVATINELEELRRQLAELTARLAGRPEWEGEVGEAAVDLAGQLTELEDELFDLRMTSAEQDFLRWPRKLYGRLSYLGGYLSRGDSPPTDSQHEVLGRLEAEVAAMAERMAALRQGPLAGFNRMLRDREVPHLLVAGTEPPPAVEAR